MSVIRGALEVPPSVKFELNRGTLELCGSVVRNAKTKQVVMWLKEAQIADGDDIRKASDAVVNAAKDIGVADKLKDAARAARNNKPVAIAIGIAAGVAIAAGAAYKFVRKPSKTEEMIEVSAQAAALDQAICAYSAAANSGDMRLELIDNLIAALEAADEDAEIKLSVKDFKKFVASVREYTKRLCAANGVSAKGLAVETRKKDSDSLITCLEFQKKVFAQAA